MTREEIMKMDGQALCDWMGSKGVEFYEECVFSYDGEKSVWKICICTASRLAPRRRDRCDGE